MSPTLELCHYVAGQDPDPEILQTTRKYLYLVLISILTSEYNTFALTNQSRQ